MIRLTIIVCFCVYGVFSFSDPNEVVFPILKLSDKLDAYNLIKDLGNSKFPISFDVERTRTATDEELSADVANYENLDHFRALDFVGLVQKHEGYTAEEHYVTTDDGYNLTLHRISGSPEYPKKPGKDAIYIQHGLFLSSDAYVLGGPGKDLAFRLAESGYDVWLGNARGNSYSRSHEYLFTNNSDFWDFSFEEIGKYDMKAFVDYIFKETNDFLLDIIGYNIGATESYVFLSEYPEYNKKIRVLISMSPLAFWQDPDSGSFPKCSPKTFINEIEKIRDKNSVEEMYPQSSFMQYIWYKYCSAGHDDTAYVCKEILKSFFDEIDFNVDKELLQYMMRHVPSGTSAKTLIHLLQLIDSGKFQTYNNGYTAPESYDLKKVTVASAVFTGYNEHFICDKDYEKLLNSFSNMATYRLQAGEIFQSADFLWGRRLNDINKSIITLLKNF